MLSPTTLEALDRLNARVMSHAAAARFIPTGTVKLLGERFTRLGVDTSVGFFFEAMFQTGVYWRFLGLSQILAGVLLLWPRTAFWGAVLFLPILVNVVGITLSMDFAGTPLITVGMLLANLWLMAWDWPRWRSVLRSPDGPPLTARWSTLERSGWALGTVSLLGFFFVARGTFGARSSGPMVLAGVLGGLMVLAAWVIGARRSRA
jgi:hypothetical protein